MKKPFGARRVPRKIGQDDDDEEGSALSSGNETGTQTPEPVVKRPTDPKAKKRSSLRLSFGPGESVAAYDDGAGSDDAVFVPRKSNLSRLATERNAERKGLRASLSSDRLLPVVRRDAADERPSYSKEALAELRDSQPSTPKRADAGEDGELERREVDVALKFGPLATSAAPSAIPTDAEIREKKERRRRLAQDPEYMSLDGDDDGDGRDRTVYDADNAFDSDDLDHPRDVSIRTAATEKYPEGRLVRDDADVEEGFDEFVEDGRISLGRKAEREAARRRREEMASMIADAEGAASGDDGMSDDSEAERNAAYEASQTKAGAYASRTDDADDARRPRTPPKISPIRELGSVLARLRASLQEHEAAKTAHITRMDGLARERVNIASQENWIQSQLKIAGEKYERLRIEAGGPAGAVTPVNGVDSGAAIEWGLESLGGTPALVASDAEES